MDFSSQLITWYNINKRDLPWRNTSNAYKIWLSEIILQQTRVQQGLPYFLRFIEKYPDVSSFATATEDEILKLWQGLGYYSRARNMLKTALMVQKNYNGKFPDSYKQLIKLKGIGGYTAAAIASFSTNEAKAVVDGNVYRVLARYFGIVEPINSTKGKKVFQETADNVLNIHYPGLHNQAIMEFGAMLCKPKNPGCSICPVRESCYAFLHHAIHTLPVKENKIKIRERYFNYFLVADNDTILVNKRNLSDIWANMYDLPLFETSVSLSVEKLLSLPEVKKTFGNNVIISEVSSLKKHMLTHQRLYVRVLKVKDKPTQLKESWSYISAESIKNLAIPKILFIFLEKIFNL